MSLPTDIAAQHLFDSVDALWEKPSKGSERRIDSLRRRFRAALERDRTGSVIPDGYPTNTSGGPVSGVGSSSTERAAVALADGDVVRDRHHDLTVRAAGALEELVVQANILRLALDSIDDLTNDSGPAPKTCAHCTGKRGHGNDRPVAHRGTVGDRLERAMDLCEACWSFVRWSAKPNTRAGYLPTDTQIRDHEERGRWRMRVA